MSGHTKGPWRIGSRIDGHNTRICTIVGGHAIHGADTAIDDWRGDAHLIAAAPELLEALEECRIELFAMIEEHNKQDAEDGSWLYDYQTVAEADAAIAKAKGEQLK